MLKWRSCLQTGAQVVHLQPQKMQQWKLPIFPAKVRRKVSVENKVERGVVRRLRKEEKVAKKSNQSEQRSMIAGQHFLSSYLRFMVIN